MTGSRLTLNTSSFVTYAQVYELSLIVGKDTRKGMVKMDIDLGVLPVPLLEIDCAAPGLCFPTFGGIFVNPTSRFFVLTIRLFQRPATLLNADTTRLALRSSCYEGCEVGVITNSWNIKYPQGLNVKTLSCDLDLTTSTTSTTT